MTNLQEMERPIDEAIVNELIRATPEWWRSAVLEITRANKANNVEGFAHVITSPEGHRDVVGATDDIFAATFQLADLFAKFGKPWRKVIYSVNQSSNGAWHYSADYEY